MTHTSVALLSPMVRTGPAGTRACSPSVPSHHPASPWEQPSPGPGPAALPETLMGTTLVWTEQDWCHCFSSTVGRGKALGQAVCLSGVVGRLREASGGLTPSAVAPLLSSSLARRLGGCRERHVSGQTHPGACGGDRKGHLWSCCPISRANPFSPPDAGAVPPCPAAPPNAWARGSLHSRAPGLTISTNSRRLEGGGRGEGSGGVPGDGWPVARKVCPVTLLSYCSSYSSARETAGPCSSCQLGGRRSTKASVPGLSVPAQHRWLRMQGRGPCPCCQQIPWSGARAEKAPDLRGQQARLGMASRELSISRPVIVELINAGHYGLARKPGLLGLA